MSQILKGGQALRRCERRKPLTEGTTWSPNKEEGPGARRWEWKGRGQEEHQ